MCKVINLNDYRKLDLNPDEKQTEFYFDKVKNSNRKRAERQATDRATSNDSVLRSYRIKH